MQFGNHSTHTLSRVLLVFYYGWHAQLSYLKIESNGTIPFIIFFALQRIPINGPVTFCDRISLEEFETQKQTAQTEAMSSLLESIIADEQLSSKEKSKKLIQVSFTCFGFTPKICFPPVSSSTALFCSPPPPTQFKQMYPEIYHTKFPDGNHDSAVMRPRLKSSKSQILTRLKSIRIWSTSWICLLIGILNQRFLLFYFYKYLSF